MQTSKSIAQIMEELGLDPNDARLRATVEQLIAARPQAELNDAFVSELRGRLAEHANYQSQPQPQQSINYFAIFMKRTIVTAVVVLLVVVAGGAWLLKNGGLKPINQEQQAANELLSAQYAVTDLAANSFGELTTQNLSANPSANGIGGGGNTSANASEPAADQKMIAPGEPAPGGGDTLPPYQPETYVFAYKGEPISGLNNEEPVFKRLKPRQSPDLVDRIVNTLSLGLIDLTRFHDAQLESFSLVEDRDMGYSVNVLLTQGSVSIYQNWYKWPQPYATCAENQNCWEQNRIKPEQMPSDEEAFQIADNFLDSYNVSRSGYGKPVIQFDQWRHQYDLTPDKSQFYFPEVVQITYPLILDNKTVYDEGGYLYGLNVTVDVRTHKVSSVYEITNRQFQKSAYTAETDAKRILGIAERGGFRNYIYEDPNAKKVTLELGTPTREMVNMWYGANATSQGEPVYVPALVFPIKNWEGTNYWRKNVIVPLVKEILDSDNSGGPITIMGGAGGTGSGVAEPATPVEPPSVPETKKDANTAQ